jgi:hypothetical protein
VEKLFISASDGKIIGRKKALGEIVTAIVP